MRNVVCPLCAGPVWVRDVLVAESAPTGVLLVSRVSTSGPLRWTCARCGYMDSPDGTISARLDGAAHAGGVPVALR